MIFEGGISNCIIFS